MHSEVYLSEDNLREIAANCSTELRQIGFRNRIWLVDRIPASSLTQAQRDSQEVSIYTFDGRHVFFRRWDMSAGTFPEVLLVVRACKFERGCKSVRGNKYADIFPFLLINRITLNHQHHHKYTFL